jgi:hypothetical protein
MDGNERPIKDLITEELKPKRKIGFERKNKK